MSTALGNTAQRNAQRTTTRKCDASGHLVFDRGDWVTHAQCRGTDRTRSSSAVRSSARLLPFAVRARY